MWNEVKKKPHLVREIYSNVTETNFNEKPSKKIDISQKQDK